MNDKITIDTARCTGCMACVDICFINYEKSPDGKVRRIADSQVCFDCGHCLAACPADAIIHADFPSDQYEVLDQSARPGWDRFHTFLKMRRSRREFKPDPVPREAIDKLIAAALTAPDALSQGEVQYTVITNPERLRQISEQIYNSTILMVKALNNPIGRAIFRLIFRKSYKSMIDIMPLAKEMIKAHNEHGMDVVSYNAPCLILVHAHKDSLCADENCVYAASNILLAAETLGLGTIVLGFITDPANQDPRIKELVQIQKNHKIITSIAVGYPKFQYKKSIPRVWPKVKYVE